MNLTERRQWIQKSHFKSDLFEKGWGKSYVKKKKISWKSKNSNLRFYIFHRVGAESPKVVVKNPGKKLWMCKWWKSISQITVSRRGLRPGDSLGLVERMQSANRDDRRWKRRLSHLKDLPGTYMDIWNSPLLYFTKQANMYFAWRKESALRECYEDGSLMCWSKELSHNYLRKARWNCRRAFRERRRILALSIL